MSYLANIIWIITSFYVPIFYFLGGLLLFPLLPFLMPVIKFSFLPFGQEIVSEKYLRSFKKNSDIKSNWEKLAPNVKFLANTIWIVTFGWIMALAHIVAGLSNFIFCFLIITIPITIPNIMAHFKMVPVALAPFGKQIISHELAQKLRNFKANEDFKILRKG